MNYFLCSLMKQWRTHVQYLRWEFTPCSTSSLLEAECKLAYFLSWHLKGFLFLSYLWQSEDEDLKIAQLRKISLLIEKVSFAFFETHKLLYWCVNEIMFLLLLTCYPISHFQARISKKHHVLEIGFGWGSLAIEVVKRTGCQYTGITLSEKQLRYAEQKVKEAGLQVSHSMALER